ncbi:diguanylate cyclase [uncultured Pseudomonas sp.]|uniref:sensor domain-containing diguanylate cyclase n=1 Tax=uncultured Pseudomonas sp. TaxID=114707 RepID=UPI0030DA0757|tara:strand:+ start:1736 stop:3460 length:1725 start_codon:yes stop_codon:yes gene_type:complete
MTQFRIFFLLGWVLLSAVVQAEPRLELSSPKVNLTDFRIGYYIDDSRELTYQQVRDRSFRETASTTSLGTNARVAWYKVILANTAGTELQLDVQMPHAYHIESIAIHEERNGQQVNSTTLELNNAANSDIMYHGIAVYPITLPADSITTLYVRSFAYSHQWFALNIFDEEHSRQALVGTSNDIALLVGMMLALVFYNFLLYFATSKLENIFYSFYLVSGLIWIALSYGLVANLFNLYGDEVFMLNISLITMPIFLVLFMMAIFETKTHYPTEHRFLQGLLLPLCCMFVWGLFDISAALKPASTVAAIMMLVTLSVTLSLLRKGNPLAKFFLIGHGFFVIFNIMAVLFYKGLIEPTYLASHGVGIGIMLEALMLAFIISHRIKILEDIRASQDELKKQAATDPLTRLYNRRYFFAEAGYLMEVAKAHQQPLAVLAIDIDHFKRVNDSHGHAVGDQVIISLTRALKAQSRNKDLLARFGGEEFVMLLPDTDIDQAQVCAERVRAAIAALRIDASPTEQLSLTVSIGVAAIDLPTDSIESALNRADKALYEAKHKGRDRVCLYSENATTEPGVTPTA